MSRRRCRRLRHRATSGPVIDQITGYVVAAAA
jgi:hypothetical protein